MFDETLEIEWLALMDLLMGELNVLSDTNSQEHESLQEIN
jgi:hypothetical protein